MVVTDGPVVICHQGTRNHHDDVGWYITGVPQHNYRDKVQGWWWQVTVVPVANVLGEYGRDIPKDTSNLVIFLFSNLNIQTITLFCSQVFQVLLPLVSCSVTITYQLYSFSNEEKKDWGGNRCDGLSNCDTVFHFCFDKPTNGLQ